MKVFAKDVRKEKNKGILEIIHSDVCSPMSSSSLSGYVYYVSFIDYFSRKAWIYFLKSKDEVFSKFKEFKSLIENQTEKRIKTFRSDNGGEFTSNEFKELCKDSGIKRELITPYNPQQNGVSEMNNRTIMEATRAMLHDQDLPMHLWQKLPRQWCMYRTILHTEYSRTRHLKKSFPARNQKLSISEYSAV